MEIYNKLPDGWIHLTRGVQSPKGADWIYNGEPMFKGNTPNLERKTGLLVTDDILFKKSKLRSDCY